MSIHVERAEPNRWSYRILVIGLLCAFGAFMIDAYKAPRTVYVEAKPETAKLYIENNVVCESLPCEITLRDWPKVLRVVADGHYSQEVPISIIEHFISEQNSYEIKLKAFPFRAPEPNITLEEKTPSLSQSDITPKRKYSPPPRVPESKPKADIPMECRETGRERQQIQNRSPVLCYYEDDKAVTHESLGECYAAYWVSVKGRAQKLQGFGCMHDELIEVARRAFKNRIYLPGLKNGKPVEKAVETEIRYGPTTEQITPPENNLGASASLNGDAQILSCPPVDVPKSMTRSGHCIFEFDLSKEGQISKIRQTRCTHAELATVASFAFELCRFRAARTDGFTVERQYMKYQIDVDVYDSQGRKTPVHASFGDKSVNKPYITY